MENNKCPKINEFCYVCGHIVSKIEGKERKNSLSQEFKFAYTQYFDEFDSSGEDFTPNTVSNVCYSNLLHCLHGRRAKLQFSKPVIWVKDPNGHDESRCYACMNFSAGNNKNKKQKIYCCSHCFTSSATVC